MNKKGLQKLGTGFLTATIAISLSLTGCSTNNGGSSEPSKTAGGASSQPASESPKSENKERSEVSFWYLWTGAEGEAMEKLIAEFNGSQDQYTVKGLSVPDMQKIIVALSSGSGPDVTDNFSSNTASYAEKGILEPLDEYIARDNYDVSDFVPAVLDSSKYDGKLYALPSNVSFNMMFYNKKLFAEAGIANPPKTDEELLEFAVKLTQVNADKTIKVLGFPDYPFVYYPNSMTYAMGGDYISADGKLTPNNPGTLTALKLIQSYREQFGQDNIAKFSSSAKYMDATDPFMTGNQAIRFDGPWFGHIVKNVLKITDLDYGVAPLPAPAGKPELAGGGEVSSSTFFIAKSAKNKEGAWAFLSWLMSKETMVKMNKDFGSLPARSSLYDDPSLQSIPDFQAFAEAAKSPNLKSFPAISVQAEYNKVIADEFELAANGKKSAEDALKAAEEKSQKLQ